MRHTFAGLSFAGAPIHTAVLARDGSGALTFTTGLAAAQTLMLGGSGKLSFPGNFDEASYAPIRVMAIASGISAVSQRFAYQADLEPAGANFARPGVVVSATDRADLIRVTALQAAVTPFQAFVPGATGSQPGYLVTNDEDTVITFAAGSGGHPRIDLVVVRVRDTVHDGSGAQTGTVEVVQGTPAATPAAPATPATSVALWEVLVPGSATGAVGVDFSTARTDRRPWTTAIGGLLPVADVTARDAVTSPYPGMPLWRADTRWRETHDGTAWRVKGPVAVPNQAALAWVTHPYDGQVATSYSDNDLLQWDAGTFTWVSFVKAALPYGHSTWTQYGPQLIQSTPIPNTITMDSFTQTGRIVTANVRFDVHASGTPNSVIKFDLPVPCVRSSGAIGRGRVFDLSANVHLVGTVVLDSTTTAKMVTSGSTDYLGATGSPFTAALTTGDIVTYAVRYEAVS